MNTKGNAKAQQTTRKIIQAFYQVYREKGQVSKVTVREICQLAQINRTSFYLHFQDVYDLLEKVEKTMEVTMTETFLREIREEQDLGAGFEALFRFVGEHREFYVIYLGEAAHPVLNIARELYQAQRQAVDFSQFGYGSQEELEYHEAFFLSGLTAMLRRWLLTGCRETPREMADILFREYIADRRLFQWNRSQP